jgi:phosphopantothenoylcysteine decarboxylase/phosphopantothenate--cysteine ligase
MSAKSRQPPSVPAADPPRAETRPLAGRELLVGVTGGIAAYKTAELVSRLAAAGAGVTVLMTESATRFVAPLTFAALSGRPCHAKMYGAPGSAEAGSPFPHLELARRAELFVIAPATANILGKLAAGIADELVSTTALAVACPLLVAPAMNQQMFRHPAVQANLKTLRRRGVRILGPATGRLACGEAGPGRMVEPEELLAEVVRLLGRKGR